MEMLGLDGAKEAYDSKRLKGLCFGEYLKKRRLLQRRPLTVAEVCRLEDIVMDEQNLVESVMAGYFLVMISLRAIFSDTHEITACTVDTVVDSEGTLRGFVDAPTARTKTGRSKEKRRILLPLCGSAIGLKHEDWLATWLKLKDEAGIDAGFMTAPDSFVSFGGRRLENREANAWLRHLLSMDMECNDSGLVGTHSCKATQLSWAAKDGLEPACRRLLGYHSSGKDQSMLTYSRDCMAKPLMEMEAVLDKIRSGEFLPDSGRAGRTVPEGSRNPTAAASVPVFSVDVEEEGCETGREVEVCENSSDGSSSAASSGRAEEEHEALAAPREDLVEQFGGLLELGLVLYKHKVFKTLRWCNPDSQTLLCGRRITFNMQRLPGAPNTDCPRCSQCEHAL